MEPSFELKFFFFPPPPIIWEKNKTKLLAFVKESLIYFTKFFKITNYGGIPYAESSKNLAGRKWFYFH